MLTEKKEATRQRDLARFERLASRARPAGPLGRFAYHLAYWVTYPLTLLECALMTSAALLNYGIWRVAYFSAWHPEKAKRRPRSLVKHTIDAQNALGVMQTVERIARDSHARLYWISGTLLGLERLGQPLPHDNDMDAGLDIDDPRHMDFIRALWTSDEVVSVAPQFISLKTRIQNPDLHVVPGGIIRYKSHVRNESAPGNPPVKTDIFLHYRYRGGSMHGSRNSLWWNTNFDVVHKRYGQNSFSVPGDTHLHLSENYGDYRTEVRDFENSIDCPNTMDIFSWGSLAYLLVRQRAMLKLGRVDRASRINARIASTILKGAVPLHLRPAHPHRGS